MGSPGKKAVVTSELIEGVELDIEADRAHREAMLTAAIKRCGELSRDLARSERVDILDLTKALWVAL